jgi:hypothetical protein
VRRKYWLELLYRSDVGADGGLGEVTALQLFQHDLAQMSHRDGSSSATQLSSAQSLMALVHAKASAAKAASLKSR